MRTGVVSYCVSVLIEFAGFFCLFVVRLLFGAVALLVVLFLESGVWVFVVIAVVSGCDLLLLYCCDLWVSLCVELVFSLLLLLLGLFACNVDFVGLVVCVVYLGLVSFVWCEFGFVLEFLFTLLFVCYLTYRYFALGRL